MRYEQTTNKQVLGFKCIFKREHRAASLMQKNDV